MRQFIWVILLLSPALVSCHQQNPYPELNDPIYEDLHRGLLAKTHALAGAKKKIVALRAALAKTKPHTIDRANDKLRLQKEKSIYRTLFQRVTYEKIRTTRRLLDDRLAYKLAFLQGKPWPNPKEYQRYLVSKQLSKKITNWDYPEGKR